MVAPTALRQPRRQVELSRVEKERAFKERRGERERGGGGGYS